jgi:hypothetical protein
LGVLEKHILSFLLYKYQFVKQGISKNGRARDSVFILPSKDKQRGEGEKILLFRYFFSITQLKNRSVSLSGAGSFAEGIGTTAKHDSEIGQGRSDG